MYVIMGFNSVQAVEPAIGGPWDRIGPGIDRKRIVDSTSRLGAGKSFAANEKNAWLDVGPGKVLRSMEASIFDKMTNQWKQAGVKRWTTC
jgi:hypothetical protein